MTKTEMKKLCKPCKQNVNGWCDKYGTNNIEDKIRLCANKEIIDINVFKPSGKWYAGVSNISVPKEFHNLGMQHSDFDMFIRKNCGVGTEASLNYKLVVTQSEDCDGFYMCMI